MPRTPTPGDILVSLQNGEEMGSGLRRCGLRIEDETSGKLIVDLYFDGPDLTALVSGRSVRLDGWRVQFGHFVGNDVKVELAVFRNPEQLVVMAEMDPEQFASLLGGKVTRLTGAQLFAEAGR